MNEIQSRLFEMYVDIKKILDSHKITFYTHFGTALGVIRHDGFIPWDDDIDLVVWEDDIPETNRVLSEELDPSKYYYHVPSADNHPHVILKTEDFESDLCNRRCIFIDIFPISRYPSTKGRTILGDALIWGSLISIWVLDHIKSRFIHRLFCSAPNRFKKLALMVVNDDSDLTVVHATLFKDYIFPASYYGEPVMHKFEDGIAPLPHEWDKILTIMFGDYMTPPPEDERVGALGFPCGAYLDYTRRDRNGL